jgi:carboxylesterase
MTPLATGAPKTPYTLVNPHLAGGAFFLEGGPDGVLLCHGFTATAAEVRPLAEHLQARGYTVAGPLLPGHGTQPADLLERRWPEWYAAVEATYQQLLGRCQRVAVGGESLGSLLTLRLASRHPEIAAVLSFAPVMQLYSRLNSLLVPWLAPLVRFRAKRPGPPCAADARWQGYDVYPLRGVRELLRLQRELRGCLPQVRQPLLVVGARLDQVISPAAPQIVYDRVSSTVKELHWMAQSTHCVMIDGEMDAVNTLATNFLSRILG